jgi:hypothetical protein
MCGGSCGTLQEAREKMLSREFRATEDIVSEMMMLIVELNNSIQKDEKENVVQGLKMALDIYLGSKKK